MILYWSDRGGDTRRLKEDNGKFSWAVNFFFTRVIDKWACARGEDGGSDWLRPIGIWISTPLNPAAIH